MIHLLPMKVVFVSLSLAAALSMQSAGARPNASTLDRNEIKRLIVEEAEATTLPPSLALALAKVESDFQGAALSDKGARGVMQIMPRTARREFGVGADELWEPRLNIQLGLSFLEQLIGRYGGRWDLALSHYNGGSLQGRGAAAQAHGYNKRYVRTVLRWQKRYAAQARVWRAKSNDGDEGWTPARTAPAPVIETAEQIDRVRREAEGEWRFQRRLRMIRRDRAAYRAKLQRRGLSRQTPRRVRGGGWRIIGADLDDFTPRWRARRVWRHG
jgi:hypothetical protein